MGTETKGCMIYWKQSENFSEDKKLEVLASDYFKFRELLDIMKIEHVTIELDHPIYIKEDRNLEGPQLKQVF